MTAADWLTEMKKVVMKSRYIIGGLILASIPRELEQTRFMDEEKDLSYRWEPGKIHYDKW